MEEDQERDDGTGAGEPGRREVLAWRQALEPELVAERSSAAARLLAGVGALRDADAIASFAATRGELDPEPYVGTRRTGTVIALPIIEGPSLRFAVDPGPNHRVQNRFGIAEPPPDADTIPLVVLGAILVPLVRFDRHGHRQGHGHGYYDRALAPCAELRWPARPYLVGLAHDEQEAELVPTAWWDVDLDVVVTPTRVIRR